MSRALKQRFVQSVRKHRLWGPHEELLVAVSGGMDSMVLLDLLVATHGLLGGVLSVCCVDHGVRGESGKKDLAFVSHACAKYGIPFRPMTLKNDRKDEAALRRKRYSALQSVGGGAVIVTAHHADDQLETVLINLIRGSGPRGLAGIPRVRDNIVRPLLDFSREQLADWAQFRSLSWREDETNQSQKYLRNKIRLSIIPELKSIQNNITNGTTRLTEQLREDDQALNELLLKSDKWDEGEKAWPTPWLVTVHPAIARRSLLLHLNGVENRHIAAILHAAHQGSGKIELGAGRYVVVTKKRTGLACE